MVSRRSFLGASASGVLAATAGCVDSLPLIGNSSSAPDGPVELAESFLADPSLVPPIDWIEEARFRESRVEFFDSSIATHAEHLSADTDLATYGQFVVPTANGGEESIESVDYAIRGEYGTGWPADDVDSQLPQSGFAAGKVGYLRGTYDRDEYENAEGVTGSVEGNSRGFDLYTDGDREGFGFSNGELLNGFVKDLRVPSREVADPEMRDVATAVLERGASRSRNTRTLPAWAQRGLEAVTPAHHVDAGLLYPHPDEKTSFEATSFHVDGPETTVMVAESAPDPANFSAEDWTEELAMSSLIHAISHLNLRPRYDSDVLQQRLLDEPTHEVGEQFGSIRAVIPSEMVKDPYLW